MISSVKFTQNLLPQSRTRGELQSNEVQIQLKEPKRPVDDFDYSPPSGYKNDPPKWSQNVIQICSDQALETSGSSHIPF
jgi:hypothetical protein